MVAWRRKGLPSAGIYTGPIAWLVSTQANYSLVPWVCGHKALAIPALALALAVVSLFGGFLSWRAWTVREREAPTSPDDGAPQRFVAALGMMTALLFAVVIVVHGAAGLVFDGCER